MSDEPTLASIGLYDKREIFRNCTVEVLTNTLTGEVSVGWYKPGAFPDDKEENDAQD